MLDMKNDIVNYLSGKEDPVKLFTILRDLGLHKGDRQYLRDVLRGLAKEGRVVRMGTRYWVPDGKAQSLRIKRDKTVAKNTLTGRFTTNTKGQGFVAFPDGKDWMVEPHSFHGAKHGDTVKVKRVPGGKFGRTWAEVIDIESYGINKLLGLFYAQGGKVEFLPFRDIKVSRGELLGFPKEVTHGSVGCFTRRPDARWDFGGVLGMMSDPAVDEAIVLAENEIESAFPDNVLAQVAEYEQGFEFDPEGRRDFRDELVFTIDGADARDFDDALHFKVLDDGLIEVGIHIADVAEFVPEDSPLDLWARQAGNSVYLPHKAIPMLPEVLSNGLCSLRPGEPHYTLSVVVRMSRDGVVEDFEIVKGLIESRFRLTYTRVVAMIVDKDEALRQEFAPVVPSLETAMALSRAMRERRIEAGSLNLDMTEVKVDLSPEGLVQGVVELHQTDANRLIEAFMCLANECVAEFMSDKGVPIPYRIHEQPDIKRLQELAALLTTFGYKVPDDLTEQTGHALNQLIDKIKQGYNAKVLQTRILKSLKLAEYNVENRGHFGLASEFYAHFTSPIRRYADLVIHRRLTRMMAGLEPSIHGEDDEAILSQVCSHISKRERAAMKAEQAFVQLKLMRHLEPEAGNDLEGVISDVKPYGFFVELLKIPASGLVPLDTLDDDYELIPERLMLVGRNTSRLLKVGMEITVKIVKVDLIRRRMDLELVNAPQKKAPFFIKDAMGDRRGGRSDRGDKKRGGSRFGGVAKGRPGRDKPARTLGKSKKGGRKK